jgi:hypothetical protein
VEVFDRAVCYHNSAIKSKITFLTSYAGQESLDDGTILRMNVVQKQSQSGLCRWIEFKDAKGFPGPEQFSRSWVPNPAAGMSQFLAFGQTVGDKTIGGK